MSRWPALVGFLAAILVGGCKPPDWLSDTSRGDGGGTAPLPVVEPPPAPDPVPDPDPLPDPEPDLIPGEPGIVVDSTNLIVPEKDGVRLTVMDGSLEGDIGYPVLDVVSLEYGRYQTTDRFRITNAAGNPFPAQFEIVNRWWARDNSIRHVAAHFAATVAPANQSYYFFKIDNDTKGTPAKTVGLTNAAGSITVDTHAVRFRISKTAFNLFDEVYMDQTATGAMPRVSGSSPPARARERSTPAASLATSSAPETAASSASPARCTSRT